MSTDLKIATLIISSNTYPAVRNSSAQKKIFFKEGFDKNLTYWYRGGLQTQSDGQNFKVVENDLIINVDDGSTQMGKKTLLALDWLENNRDYDFIVRPTPSSYVNLNNLHDYIKKNLYNKEHVFAGKIQSTNDKLGNKINFVSGSTFILNKKTVGLILKNQEYWDHEYWDDVALSLLTSKLNISPQVSDRFDVEGNPFKQKLPTNYYQYRCRADNHYGYPRYLESYTLKIVSRVVNNKNHNFLNKFISNIFFELSKFFYIYQFSWKVYEIIRYISKKLFPKFLYEKIKHLLSDKIENFKHVRFKT